MSWKIHNVMATIRNYIMGIVANTKVCKRVAQPNTCQEKCIWQLLINFQKITCLCLSLQRPIFMQTIIHTFKWCVCGLNNNLSSKKHENEVCINTSDMRIFFLSTIEGWSPSLGFLETTIRNL